MAVVCIVIDRSNTLKGQYSIIVQAPGHGFPARAGVQDFRRSIKCKMISRILEILITGLNINRDPQHFGELAVYVLQTGTIGKRFTTHGFD